MSDAERLQKVLQERARKLAARSSELVERKVHATTAIVVVGSESFAIPSEFVRGIVPLVEAMRLPGLPAHLLGIVHFRGELISVVDLGLYLGARGATRPRFLVVVRGGPGLIGLGVEEVLEFRALHEDEVEANAHAGNRPLRAVTRDLVQVLDIPRLVSDEALVVQ